MLFCLTSNYLSSQVVSNQVLSAYVGLTTVFGMGTGGTPQLSSLDLRSTYFHMFLQNLTEELAKAFRINAVRSAATN